MDKSAKEHIIYLDVIRVVACFWVILVHVSSDQMWNLPTNSLDYQVSIFFNTFSISAPAIFFMLSGAIFLNPEFPAISVKKLWGKYILRMAVAYVFWSYLYTFIIWLPYYTFSFETVKAYIREFFTGIPMYHMWFIPAIISIYMVLPLLKPAFADKQRCKYYLFLFTVIQILIPTILKFDFPYKFLLNSVYSRPPYLLCIGYVGYFVLGYYLSIEEFHPKIRIILYVSGILGLLTAVGIDVYFSLCQDTVVLMMSDMFSLNSFFLAIAVFVGFRYIPWHRTKTIRVISKLSRLTFGIYLVHPFFLKIITEHCLFLFQLPAIVWIPTIGMATFFCSTIVSWIINKIPIANKYLV